jgi:hypothetical protein
VERGSGFHRSVDLRGDLIARADRTERCETNALIHRVADLGVGEDGCELLQKSVGDLLVEQEALRAVAHLSRPK